MKIEEAAQLNIKRHRRTYTAKDGRDFKCVHEDGCYPYLATVVGNYNPELIIELGTSWGGLTKFFEDHAPNAYIYSFDKPKAGRKPNPAWFGSRVTFLRADLLTKPCPAVVAMCQSASKKLLYCDNGNKVTEVLYYAQYLNRGDLLGVHDWPREIYTSYTLLKPAAKRHTSEEDIVRLRGLLDWFEPVWHDKMLSHGFSTRFWRKIV